MWSTEIGTNSFVEHIYSYYQNNVSKHPKIDFQTATTCFMSHYVPHGGRMLLLYFVTYIELTIVTTFMKLTIVHNSSNPNSTSTSWKYATWQPLINTFKLSIFLLLSYSVSPWSALDCTSLPCKSRSNKQVGKVYIYVRYLWKTRGQRHLPTSRPRLGFGSLRPSGSRRRVAFHT